MHLQERNNFNNKEQKWELEYSLFEFVFDKYKYEKFVCPIYSFYFLKWESSFLKTKLIQVSHFLSSRLLP